MTRAWVEIDAGALYRNGAAVAARSGAPILPVLTADAFGLGAMRAALALDALNPWGFGVSDVAGGEALRRAGISRPIIVFTPILRTEIDALRRADLTPALGDPAVIESWARTGRPWHLQIDTGTSCAGMPWNDVANHHSLFQRAEPAGVSTHFRSVPDASQVHERRFRSALSDLPKMPALVHAENGPVIEKNSPSPWTLYRPGMFLFGVVDARDAVARPEGVVAIRARIVELRTIADGEGVGFDASWRAHGSRRIATVPLGYADGYRRSPRSRGIALLNGKRVSVADSVADMTMIDVTDTGAELGDVVTLLGADGAGVITVSDVAERCELTVAEVLTGLGGRLPRCYLTDTANEAAA